MAVFNIHVMVLAFFAITGILISDDNNMVYGQEQCQGDLQGLISQCATYVQKSGVSTNPSQACCNVIKAVDIPCVCKYITKDIEQIVDMAKVVHVAEFCGTPLPHGMKCGSYIVHEA
ncbi:LTP_2 domain-containing protein [Cephalotus follicularis]|uniref:LTP_2 domain-containing protein n=1 Tax=Cephalotus follicularis TaxID=3775 RepID=A0A1Q3C7U9_CEPFO|nr:LTP_2 domain-containing protein [Cephalotus follicularis]